MSLAEPENQIDVPAGEDAPFAGVLIVTAGAVLSRDVSVPYKDRAPAISSEANVRQLCEQYDDAEGYIVASVALEWPRPSACPSSCDATSSMYIPPLQPDEPVKNL